MSMFPWSSQPTTTTFMPAMTAEAGLVPCAEDGNQAHVAVAFAARLVVGADDHQPRKLPLRA